MQLPCRAVWLHLAGRSRRRRDQDRVAAGRHAAPVSVEPARRGPVFPRHEPRQARAGARSEAEGGARGPAPHGRERRRAGREFPSVGAGAARDRLSAPQGDQSAPDLCRADRLRRRGSAQRKGRFRSGPAMPERDGGIPGRRRRETAAGARLGARLFHVGAACLWRRRGAVSAREERPGAISEPVTAAQRADDPGRPLCLGRERGARRGPRFRHRRVDRHSSDKTGRALYLGPLEPFLRRAVRAGRPPGAGERPALRLDAQPRRACRRTRAGNPRRALVPHRARMGGDFRRAGAVRGRAADRGHVRPSAGPRRGSRRRRSTIRWSAATGR